MDKFFYTILGLGLILLMMLGIAFGLGFLVQLVANPILLQFGLQTVSTQICTSIILLVFLVKVIFS